MDKYILLVDYGGVLGYDHIIENEEKLAQRLGMTQIELNNRLSEKSEIGRKFRENKLSEFEFWSAVSPEAIIDDETTKELALMWMDTYALNADMMEYLQSLRKIMKVGVLTNIDIGRDRLLRVIVDVDNNLDFYYPSFEFGVSKDDPTLWQKINIQIRSEDKNSKIIYVDDRAEHVVSARNQGWVGIKYYSLSLLKKQLRIVIGMEPMEGPG